MFTEEALSFAYKFPFSNNAKDIVHEEPAPTGEDLNRVLRAAKSRLEEAFTKGKIEFRDLKYGKLDYVIGYPYCRLLVSAMGSRLALFRYVYAEAKRSREALETGTLREALALSESLGLKLTQNRGEFNVRFNVFLNYMSGGEDFNLSKFRIHFGSVILSMHELSELLENAMAREMLRLPFFFAYSHWYLI